MQNLIIGERYKLKHPTGYWEGEVTIAGFWGKNIKISDVTVYGKNRQEVEDFFKNKGASLNGDVPWNFELIDFTLENE